ncbi:M23 family metallopeptidase [Archangium primigenium]|uniref:M23 family metallopeptidase n=1 Tax=[Archangium] primigenium TaxID=2792470 RepID=UPI001958830B|nr:M23 family metallopeptidase [Archangium primigenium]MBM7114410.1 M23 family metallopeptidase [Archangium primigenium]
MFARPARGLLDFSLVLLCVWTAWHHTPAGALVRRGTAWALGHRSTARALLDYYALDVPPPASATGDALDALVPLPTAPPPVPLAAPEALAHGSYLAFQALSVEARAPVLALARERGLSPELLSDSRQGPVALGRLHAALAVDFPDEESRLAALFVGRLPTHYALERLAAEGHAPSLKRLAQQWPPGYEAASGAAVQALALATAFSLAWPVPEHSRISSPFGMRTNPVLGVKKLHTGVDLAVRTGTEVRAVADGTVSRASEDAVNGRVVLLRHERGVTTAYCHNSALRVRPGDRVKRGQVIALSGSTGRSTGPHLHYQLTLFSRPVDPLRFRPRGLAVVDNAFSE